MPKAKIPDRADAACLLCGKRWGERRQFLYRKTGMKFIFQEWGCSIYAYFQKI